MGTHSHSNSSPGHKMVAAQVLLGLWATGLAVAAPQLDFGDSRSRSRSQVSGVNQDQVVSDVVTALQPSIEAAIAEALASLRATSVNSYSNNDALLLWLLLRSIQHWWSRCCGGGARPV